MILFEKNTCFNIESTKNVKDNFYTQIFTIDNSNDKCIYQGSMIDNGNGLVWEGYGKLWTKDKIYNGYFENGNLDGKGIFRYIGKSKDLNKEFVTYYEGEIKKGYKDGSGLEIYYNEESYKGSFFKSLRHGNGTYFASNGSEKIKANWEMGYAKGTESITEYWDNGNIKYKGGFNGRKPHKKGVWCYKDGNICFDGIFDDGKPVKGIIKNKLGMNILSGCLNNDGNVILYHENGNKFLEYNLIKNSESVEYKLIEFYENGQMKFKGTMHNNILFNFSNIELIDIYSHIKSIDEEETEFKKNYKEGIFYYKNTNINSPKIEFICSYNENGNFNGDYKEFSKSGLLVKHTNYKNGILDGEYKTYYENGRPHIEGIMKNGSLEGIYREFSDNENSTILKEGTWESGVPNGVLTNAVVYNSNNKKIYEGNISATGKYIDQGKLYYDNESNSIKYDGNFSNGKYHNNGSLYFPNGNFSYQGDWNNGRRNGQGTSYYESTGTMEYLGDWINDEKHGNGCLFNEAGEQVWSGSFHYNEIQIPNVEG